MANTLRTNIELMNSLESFDVVIVCCGKPDEAKYWQTRLTNGKGSVLAEATTVVAVHEDWPGGAGNALGTMYAFQNACTIAKETSGMDLHGLLSAGTISVGLFHTAGKGTRMAPLPGAENNNKPGVKLPATVVVAGREVPITILESVVKQTGCYAKSRMGRLSVFWGDQIFVPTVAVAYKPAYHADILCTLGPMMNEEEWAAKGMDKYGLIAVTVSGKAAQVEKVTHKQAIELLEHLDEIKAVGASLGSFSVSAALLSALLLEFTRELAAKEGKLDSDPHLWMPMTLQRDSYIEIMCGKGVSEESAGEHYDRIGTMMDAFLSNSENADLGTFGPVDIGAGPCWWDYGQVKLYAKNALLITDTTEEAGYMRQFFCMEGDRTQGSKLASGVTVDALSVVAMSDIGSGSVSKSVLTGVKCRSIEADGCILVNVTADRIVAKPGSILYNVSCIGTLSADADGIHAGVTKADGTQVIIRSSMNIDGGKAWDLKVEGNEFTFGEVHSVVNADASPLELEAINARMHAEAWEVISSSPADNESNK